MELNRQEVRQIKSYLQSEQNSNLSEELLNKIEIGLWVFPPLPLIGLNILGFRNFGFRNSENTSPFLLAGEFGGGVTKLLLDLFIAREFPYLLVRANSWECFLNCNGEIMTEHCDENLDAVREACERLRERCGDGVPSVSRQ